MYYRITILGRLDGANEYINACRVSSHFANKMKKNNQKIISAYIRNALGNRKISTPIHINYSWYEKTAPNGKNRDIDNIAFSKKFIQDSLVDLGYLEDDGWVQIYSFSDNFYIDNENPRIEIEIIELD